MGRRNPHFECLPLTISLDSIQCAPIAPYVSPFTACSVVLVVPQSNWKDRSFSPIGLSGLERSIWARHQQWRKEINQALLFISDRFWWPVATATHFITVVSLPSPKWGRFLFRRLPPLFPSPHFFLPKLFLEGKWGKRRAEDIFTTDLLTFIFVQSFFSFIFVPRYSCFHFPFLSNLFFTPPVLCWLRDLVLLKILQHLLSFLWRRPQMFFSIPSLKSAPRLYTFFIFRNFSLFPIMFFSFSSYLFKVRSVKWKCINAPLVWKVDIVTSDNRWGDENWSELNV